MQTMGVPICMVSRQMAGKIGTTFCEFFRWEKFTCLETYYETAIAKQFPPMVTPPSQNVRTRRFGDRWAGEDSIAQ